MTWGGVPDKVPCEGPDSIEKLSGSPSGSEPVSVIALGVFSVTSTDWLSAVGGWLTFGLLAAFKTAGNSNWLQAEYACTSRMVPRRLPAQSLMSDLPGSTTAVVSRCLGGLH